MIIHGTITPATNVFMALSDDDYLINRVQILTVGGDLGGIISISAVFYIEEADFTTGTEFLIGTIDEPITIPSCYVVTKMPDLFLASSYHNAAGAPFAGVQDVDRATITISPNGGIYARINTVTTPATLGGTDYIVIPLFISYNNVEQVVAI